MTPHENFLHTPLAVGTNGCVDLRRHASALDGRVSAEWSRCPGTVARRARDNVAPLQRSSAGWMPARIGSLSAGVGHRHPVTIHKASLMAGSIRRVWALRHQTGAQYSTVIIKKVDTSFLGVAKREKNSDFRAILRFKPLICQSVDTTPTKLAESVYFGVLQLPNKFQAKILTGKFYLGKNQNIH